MDRLHLFRLRRAYRMIPKLEERLISDFEQHPDAAKMRADFASETIQRIRTGFKIRGVSNAEVRAWIKRLVKGQT